MTGYTDTIYGIVSSEYDYELCWYLYENYLHKTGMILDVGCGKGTHMNLFTSIGFDAWGLDIRKETDNKKIRICDIENDKFPYKSNTFNYIFSKSLIEHIHRPDNCLKEMYRVLKPGGRIIIMTPDWKSQMKHFWDDYSHYHAYTSKSLKDILTIFGFRETYCIEFYQLPFIWYYPYLRFIPKIISFLPDSLKWKTRDMRNGEDRKLIRFSKEKMLLGVGYK